MGQGAPQKQELNMKQGGVIDAFNHANVELKRPVNFREKKKKDNYSVNLGLECHIVLWLIL